MPANYAHFRFAQQMLPLLPAEVRAAAEKQKHLYDFGAHGPDFFFYHSMLHRTTTVELGYQLHRKSGKEFFGSAAKKYRLQPSEGYLAYLFGALTHYALDSCCHPLICDWDSEGASPHIATETEFDRFLLLEDDIPLPEYYDTGRHLSLNRRELAVLQQFYGISEKELRKSVDFFRLAAKAVSAPPGIRRNTVAALLSKFPAYADLMMGSQSDPRCSHLHAPLMEKYHEAANKFPLLAAELYGYLKNSTPLSQTFAISFG